MRYAIILSALSVAALALPTQMKRVLPDNEMFQAIGGGFQEDAVADAVAADTMGLESRDNGPSARVTVSTGSQSSQGSQPEASTSHGTVHTIDHSGIRPQVANAMTLSPMLADSPKSNQILDFPQETFNEGMLAASQVTADGGRITDDASRIAKRDVGHFPEPTVDDSFGTALQAEQNAYVIGSDGISIVDSNSKHSQFPGDVTEESFKTAGDLITDSLLIAASPAA